MKNKILNRMGLIISVFCLMSSYYLWSQAKALNSNNKFDKGEYSIAKVVNHDYIESIDIEGKIDSSDKKEYTLTAEQYIISDKIKVGAEVKKGDLIAEFKNNASNNVCAEAYGKVIDISNTDGKVTIITKDLNDLNINFYVPQLYCNDYKIDDKVVLTVNGDTYSAVICKIGFEMEENVLEQEDGSVKSEACLYMEAVITDSTNLWVNEIGTITLSHVTASNTKSVPKDAIKYDGDTPYVERIRTDKKEKIVVELGERDKDMTEIISNDIMVGDEIAID